MSNLKCWRKKVKNPLYTVMINKSRGETVILWKNNTKHNKKVKSYMKKHDRC